MSSSCLKQVWINIRYTTNICKPLKSIGYTLEIVSNNCLQVIIYESAGTNVITANLDTILF